MIKSLSVRDFTVFQRADFKFGALNIIHGENSTGKTHVLKLAYTIASTLHPAPNAPVPGQPTKGWLETAVASKLAGVFRPDRLSVGRLARRHVGRSTAHVTAKLETAGTLEFTFSSQHAKSVKIDVAPDEWLDSSPAYLPTRELLSVYPGFVSLYENQAIPFDETWRDTCSLLGVSVARGSKKKEIADLFKPLEEAIGCTALLDGDRFFLKMTEPNAKVEADLVAEGYRKLSMVARLIANGSLDDKGYLFWDEPEANLNARLIRRLAPLLLDLAGGGVQVFVATHSLFLMRELHIVAAQRGGKVKTRYIGLHPGQTGVTVDQGPRIEDSGDLAALDEDLTQSDRYLDLEAGVKP